MYHNDPEAAMEELKEDAALPNPVHVRDMILRRDLTPEKALDLNRHFVEYQKAYGDMMAQARVMLEALAAAPLK